MSAPPSFREARTLRQRVRAAGLDPDYWYAAEYERSFRPGQRTSTTFWGRRLTLGRRSDGTWEARSPTGACHPVRARYGLVWIFPGDPARATERPMPELPELEGSDPWAYVPLSFTWRAHHSIIIDNLCDLTHAHLHRRYPSFRSGRLLSHEVHADRVATRCEATVGPFAHRATARPSVLEIAYEYPYHRARFEWSNIAGAISYWTFLWPLDRASTRVFFMFCYDTLAVPYVPFRLGHRLMTWVLRLAHGVVAGLLDQDRRAVEAEQAGYDAHFDAPVVELNPVVARLHHLTIAKWDACLAREAPFTAVTA